MELGLRGGLPVSSGMDWMTGLTCGNRRFGRTSRLRRTADPGDELPGHDVLPQLGVLPAQAFKLGEEEAAGSEVAEDPHGGLTNDSMCSTATGIRQTYQCIGRAPSADSSS